jgi:glyoxylase I family protein
LNDLDGFHHVSLTVRDLDAAVDWYQRVLGLRVAFREDAPTRRAAVTTFANGTFAVGLTEHRGNTSEFDPTRTGLDHLAFSVASSNDLADWEHRLTNEGVDHSGTIEIPPGAILNFHDPDSIALAFFWKRA